MVMGHVVFEPQEEQASPQPPKLEPASAVAVRVTEVLAVYGSVQSEPQLMPDGELVTVPEPVPVLVTVRVEEVGVVGVNVAVQDLFASMVTEQVAFEPQEEQSPLQPAKLELESAVAVRVTEVLAV